MEVLPEACPILPHLQLLFTTAGVCWITPLPQTERQSHLTQSMYLIYQTNFRCNTSPLTFLQLEQILTKCENNMGNYKQQNFSLSNRAFWKALRTYDHYLILFLHHFNCSLNTKGNDRPKLPRLFFKCESF